MQVGSITGTYQTKDVGTNKSIGTGTFVLSGADAGDYTLVQPTGLAASITPRPLNVAAVGIDKVYDGTTAATATLSDNRIAGDVLHGQRDRRLPRQERRHRQVHRRDRHRAYRHRRGQLHGQRQHRHFRDHHGAAALVVSASGVNKVYDATTGATVTLSDNAFGGDTLSLGYGSAAFADKNAGTGKTVTVGGITVSGTGVGNYTVSSVTTTTADITPATITQVTGISAANKVYDGTTTATLATGQLGFVGMFAGDSLTASATNAAFVDKNAGLGKTVTIGGLALGGTDAGNYTLTAGPTTSTANITPAPLVIGASAVGKVYDGTTAATVTLGDTPIGGDVVNVSYTSAAFSDKNAGIGKTVIVGGIGLNGADAGNYSFNTTASTTADIAKASLVVGAAGINKVYDATTVATVSLSDTPIGSDVVNVAYGSASYGDKNVGVGKTVSVGGITLSGADAGNYSFNTTASTTADIAKANLTVGAVGVNKVYDTTRVATVTLIDNHLGNDALVVGYGSASFADKNAGTGKTVTVGGIDVTGTDAGNYNFNTTASTTADIAKAPIVVGAVAQNKVYDATTAAVVTLSDTPLAGDVVTVGLHQRFVRRQERG